MPVWPFIPIVLYLLTLTGCGGPDKPKKKIEDENQEETYSTEEIIDGVNETSSEQNEESDTLCNCNACVICSNATLTSPPVHIKGGDTLIHLENFEELNKTTIELESCFEGCRKSPNGKCKIDKNYKQWIEDGEWKDTDNLINQGEGKEILNREKSYMLCCEYAGIIYFLKDGQEVWKLINGELIYYLSDDYIKWLETAEGFEDYPYLDPEDSQEAKNRQNVTIGIDFTFDNKGRNWDILKEVLGWTDTDINSIISGVYSGKNYSNTNYTITKDQAIQMVNIAAERTYMPDLNAAINAYNTQSGSVTTYSQRQLEAMFDYSYNNGLSRNVGGIYSSSINDQDQIIYYYLRKDRANAVKAVKNFGNGTRRRLNQMNLFFYDYNFVDKSDTDLDPLRQKLGF